MREPRNIEIVVNKHGQLVIDFPDTRFAIMLSIKEAVRLFELLPKAFAEYKILVGGLPEDPGPTERTVG